MLDSLSAPPAPAPPPPVEAPARGNPAACQPLGQHRAPAQIPDHLLGNRGRRHGGMHERAGRRHRQCPEVRGPAGDGVPGNWARSRRRSNSSWARTSRERCADCPPCRPWPPFSTSSAADGAASGNDPSPPGGFPYEQWGGNWRAVSGVPRSHLLLDVRRRARFLERRLHGGDSTGCWGHRDEILLSSDVHAVRDGNGFLRSRVAGSTELGRAAGGLLGLARRRLHLATGIGLLVLNRFPVVTGAC